jgi:hypothetical protein
LRIFLNENERGLGFDADERGHHNWVVVNQRAAAALEPRGYRYPFVTAKDLGHCDGKALQATRADALVWVWRGYP